MPGDVSHLSPTVSAFVQGRAADRSGSHKVASVPKKSLLLTLGEYFGTVTLRCSFVVTCSKQNNAKAAAWPPCLHGTHRLQLVPQTETGHVCYHQQGRGAQI